MKRVIERVDMPQSPGAKLPQSRSEGEDVVGLVSDIQRYNVHDGPGVRTLIFLKGCPLRCLWCSNPESQEIGPDIAFVKDKCTYCGLCTEVCPEGAISELIALDRSLCTKCGMCVEVCYSGALRQVGQMMKVSDVMQEVGKDEPFYRRSGGGVTLSGGEPILQAPFSREILKLCRQRYIDTALETCGFGLWPQLREVLEFTDLVLYDIKHMDPLKHKEFTGAPNQIILENAKKIAQLGIPMVIRVPLIPEHNADVENITATARFAKEELGVKELHLLPYHQYGKNKYTILGRDYPMDNIKPPDREQIGVFKTVVESFGLSCVVGG